MIAGGSLHSEEKPQFFAEHLLNNRLQMGCFGANEEFVTQTKQSKIGPCEQVRVNWKTASSVDQGVGQSFRESAFLM
jgi:hypothetical protein